MKTVDAQGREIKIGSKVLRVMPPVLQEPARTGGMAGVVTWAERKVDVTFVSGAIRTYTTRGEGFLWRRRRCLDLLTHD